MLTAHSQFLRELDGRQFDVSDQAITCWFGRKGESRRHAVRVNTIKNGIRFEATVVTAKTVDSIALYDDPHRWAWRRNRVSNLVGFRVDGQQRLIAEAVAPLI